MTGDITIGNNKIVSDIDPTDDKHLARKNYIDNKITTVNLDLRRRLNLSGGTMRGNINMRNYKISTTSDPTIDTRLTRKKYADNQNTSLKNKLNFI